MKKVIVVCILFALIGGVSSAEKLTDAEKKSFRLLTTEFNQVIQNTPRTLNKPVILRPERGTGQELVPPKDRSAVNGLLNTQLTVDYAVNEIWNVKHKKPITLRLRSYEGELVGPTLRAKPGSVIRVKLINNLPPNEPYSGDINIPHGFNNTNLHTHGLQVSPAGNSDNVLLTIAPGQDFQYEVYVPPDHPAGTFWYHPHVHGSTAIQVSSGMSGFIIIEGGLDNIPEIKAAKDQLFLLQQMPYTKADDADYYEIEDYDKIAPGHWAGSPARGPHPAIEGGVVTQGWRTTVNGQTHPSLHFFPGEMQRWRFLHAGVREKIDLCLMKASDAEKLLTSGESDLKKYRDKSIPLYEIAADGLAYGFKWKRKSIELYPGYRSDVLVRIDDPGEYVLLDLFTPAEESLHHVFEVPKLLAVVLVDGRNGQGIPMPMPADLSLRPVRPHRAITDEEVTGEDGKLRLQKNFFEIRLGDSTHMTTFAAGDPPVPFDGKHTRVLEVGKADEWHLSAILGDHPFHVHVNPFQIISHPWMTGDNQPKGDDGIVRTIFKDTLIVPDRSDIVKIRARYERYVGKFVLHCHILDHEDMGMMQFVEIVVPGAEGGHGGSHGAGH